jgi:uncharacterized protein (TIGR02246 family)
MVRAIPLALALLVACSSPPPSPPPLQDRAALTSSFQEQFARSADAWNRGDLDAFLSDYAADGLTSFVSGGHLHQGMDFIRQHYAPRFAPGASRDSLRFEEFDVRPLSPTLSLVTARFILHNTEGTTASGPFTLVMERRSDGWKILHDHTSTDAR